MSRLSEIRRKLNKALTEGKITKEVHDQVLHEAEENRKKQMLSYARQLAELESTKSELVESSNTQSVIMKKGKPSKNWLLLGMFAAAALLTVYKLQSKSSKKTQKNKKRIKSKKRK